MELTTLFYVIDEFCNIFEPEWYHHLLRNGQMKRHKPGSLSLSEILTVVVYFHQSNHRTFKGYYTKYVTTQLAQDFPGLPSYNRFVELMGECIVPLYALLTSLFGSATAANFVDSTTLSVCHNRRIRRHRVFKGLASRGKTSMGWFYGFKLHLVVNDQGSIVSMGLTPGATSDKDIPTVLKLTRKLFGKLFGDRGYVSQPLFEALWDSGVQLITGIKKNMKNKLLAYWDKLMLRKRSLIETINDILKNSQQIEHTRHRSPKNFVVNLLAGLIAYQLQPKKPSIDLPNDVVALLTV